MSFGLAREIYGRMAWAVDGETFSAYLSMIKDFRNGVDLASGEEKYNSTFLFDLKSDTRIVSNKWQARDNAKDELIYMIDLNGPITRSGGMSSYGTKDLANNIAYFESLPNVIGGIILADSGGGSTNAVEIIDSAIISRKKPIVSLLEKGTMACSACYGSISGSDYIMSDGENNKIGSLGTMADFEAIASGNKDANGVKTIRVYATKSTAKNNWYEEAANNDNFEPLISEMLDPENEIFLGRIKSNRPQIKESQLDGSVYRTKDVVGTLIDGFGNMSDAINKVKELHAAKTVVNKNKNNLNNNSKMDIETLKSEHPAVYASILSQGKKEGVQAGIAAEKDRAGSWLAHFESDPAAVKAGIEGGGSITATARENFLVAAAKAGKTKDLKSDSAPDLVVAEAEGDGKEVTEADAFYADVLKGI